MKKGIIKVLEEYLKNKKLTIDEQLELIKDSKINEALKDLFKNKTTVTNKDLNYLTNNIEVRELVETFLSENEIEIVYDDSVRYKNEDMVRQYLSEIGEIPVLSKAEEKELFNEYKKSLDEKRKKQIRNKIAETNLRLVVSVAKRYKKQGNELLDLIEEGNIGLLKAIDKFDVNLGNKFSTYATWWIRQGVERSIADKSKTIRIPVHAYEKLKKLNNIKKNYYLENGESMIFNKETMQRVANELNITTQTLDILLKQQNMVSLDRNITKESDHDESFLIDFIPDETLNVEDEVIRNIEQEEVRELLKNSNLTNREKFVLESRFGFNGDPKTLEEVGVELEVTRERVRQIEAKSLKKFRKNLYKKGYTR